MIGYFGENWSDADVIKSDLVIEDLAVTDNPYRTDVDDGYDKWVTSAWLKLLELSFDKLVKFVES